MIFGCLDVMFFLEDGRCDSLGIGFFSDHCPSFSTKGLDFIVMSVVLGLRFYKDLGVSKLGASLYIIELG